MNANEFAVCWWAYQKYSSQQIWRQTSTEVVTMIKQARRRYPSYLYAAHLHFGDRESLVIDVMVNRWYRSSLIKSFPHVWAVSIRRKQGLGDLNWNRLAAWALPCHQSTPLCVPMNSNWPQPRKNEEAVLFRQAYCVSVCGPRFVHVRLFVGLSWLTPQGRTAPKVGHAMIG